MEELAVSTKKKIQVLDITGKVTESRRVDDGCIILHVPHTTAALAVNENESSLKSDMERFYRSLAKGSWGHNRIDNNAEAHLASTTLNSSLTIPVENGKLILGRWQSILFVELDGPRERKVYVKELSA